MRMMEVPLAQNPCFDISTQYLGLYESFLKS